MEVIMAEESKLAKKYEEVTKFDKEELETIKKLQDEYVDVQSKFGQLSVQRIRLNQQLENVSQLESDLSNRYISAQKSENEFMKKLNDKYGEGTYNPEKNEFIPK